MTLVQSRLYEASFSQGYGPWSVAKSSPALCRVGLLQGGSWNLPVFVLIASRGAFPQVPGDFPKTSGF